MVMRWYDNGNATEYLAKKNPGADRKQLVSCTQKFPISFFIILIRISVGFD